MVEGILLIFIKCLYLTNIFAGYCICEMPVPAGCYGWFWLAELSLLRHSLEWFYYDILVPCRRFSLRFTSSANLVASTMSGMRTVRSVEFAPFTVPHLACVFHFFHPSHSPGWYPLFSILVVTKFGGLFRLHNLRIGSGQSSLSIVCEQIAHILGSVRAYRLTNSVPVLGFWLLVIRH